MKPTGDAADTSNLQHGPRIPTIDIVRGVAVLGILVINLADMAYPEDLVLFPRRDSDCGVLDVHVLYLSETIFAGKVRGLFAIIFGASAALLIARLTRTGSATAAARTFYRRLVWLALFGLLNAYVFLWWGDIILKYVVLGAVLFPIRNISPRVLNFMLVACFAVLILQPTLAFRDAQSLKDAYEDVEERRQAEEPLDEEASGSVADWKSAKDDSRPDTGRIADDVAARGVGYRAAFLGNASVAFEEQTVFFVQEDLADILFYMLLGTLLTRLGVFGFSGWTGKHLLIPLAATSVALTVHASVTYDFINAYPDPVASSYSLILIELTRLPVVAGYLTLLLIAFNLWERGMISRALTATGRMALTNYLLQSLIGMLLFYRFGLDLFNELCRIELFGLIVAILLLQVLASVIWMRFFKLGPFEWLWRSLTDWERKPLLRGHDARR